MVSNFVVDFCFLKFMALSARNSCESVKPYEYAHLFDSEWPCWKKRSKKMVSSTILYHINIIIAIQWFNNFNSDSGVFTRNWIYLFGECCARDRNAATLIKYNAQPSVVSIYRSTDQWINKWWSLLLLLSLFFFLFWFLVCSFSRTKPTLSEPKSFQRPIFSDSKRIQILFSVHFSDIICYFFARILFIFVAAVYFSCIFPLFSSC